MPWVRTTRSALTVNAASVVFGTYPEAPASMRRPHQRRILVRRHDYDRRALERVLDEAKRIDAADIGQAHVEHDEVYRRRAAPRRDSLLCTEPASMTTTLGSRLCRRAVSPCRNSGWSSTTRMFMTGLLGWMPLSVNPRAMARQWA